MDTNTLPFLTWIAPPPKRPVRSKTWYAVSGTIVTLLIVQSLWSGNWLFALLLCGIAGYFVAETRWLPSQPSRAVELSDDGISMNGEKTYWTELRRAWFWKRFDSIELHIERKAGFPRREILALAPGMDPQPIAELLEQRVPLELNPRASVLDAITHFLKI